MSESTMGKRSLAEMKEAEKGSAATTTAEPMVSSTKLYVICLDDSMTHREEGRKN